MAKGKYSVFMANLAMLLALESYTPDGMDVNIDVGKDIVEMDQGELDKGTMDIDIDKPQISGPIQNPPWINDEEFLEAQKQCNSHVLMAAYCSVLLDPLPGEEYNVRLAANSLKGHIIEAGGIFSQNQSIGPYTINKGYRKGASYSGGNIIQTEGGGVCKIASTLYNGAILSNLDIIERHNHSMPVNYVPYGQDATVAYGAKDFRFRNNTEGTILIWSQMIGNNLYIGLYGQKNPPEIKWSHKLLNTVEAPLYYKANLNLKKGQEKIIIKGMDGATVESTIIIKHENGKVETKDLGVSHYNPMPHIIEKNGET